MHNKEKNTKKAAGILNRIEKPTADRILDHIDHRDPPLAEEIRSHLFRFEDLLRLSDRDLVMVIQEIPNPQLLLALKGADKRLTEKVIGAVSHRRGETLRDELLLLGPKRRHEIKKAQKVITAATRLFIDQGKIAPFWLRSSQKMIY